MNDCTEVDGLLLNLAGYKNDCAGTAAETLLKKCSTSWEAFKYLQDSVNDAWLIAHSSRCDRLSKGYRCR